MKSKGDRYDLMCYLNMKTKRNEVFKRMKRLNESKNGAKTKCVAMLEGDVKRRDIF